MEMDWTENLNQITYIKFPKFEFLDEFEIVNTKYDQSVTN